MEDKKMLLFDAMHEIINQDIIEGPAEHTRILREYPDTVFRCLQEALDWTSERYNADLVWALEYYDMDSKEYENMTEEKLCIIWCIRCALFDIAYDIQEFEKFGTKFDPNAKVRIGTQMRFEKMLLDLLHENLSDELAHEKKELFENQTTRATLEQLVFQMKNADFPTPPSALKEVLFEEAWDRAWSCSNIVRNMQKSLEQQTFSPLVECLNDIMDEYYINGYPWR